MDGRPWFRRITPALRLARFGEAPACATLFAKMYVSISSLVPKADDLLALEIEEVASILLVHLNSYVDGGGPETSGIYQHGVLNRSNFFNWFDHHPEYPVRQPDVTRALLEAWSWLGNL